LNDFLQWMNWIEQTPWLGELSRWNCQWAKAILVYEDVLENDGPMNELPVYHVDESTSYFDVMFPSTFFKSLAKQTQQKVDAYLWNDEKKLYYDYDCHLQNLSVYDTVTCLWAMWAGLASPEKAHAMVPKALSLFEVAGGLVSGTEESRGRIGLDRPNRQWDFPYGWAPHQIMAWKAMKNYGFELEAERLAYRWLYTLVKSFVDFNGVVPEKFDVVSMTHKVNVEYGNVGSDFQCVVREGFGWMNASFQVSEWIYLIRRLV
jgi:alpha,alpha-trehalase